MGISSVIISPEMSRTPEESGFVDYVPEVDAIISVGDYEEEIYLPDMRNVIGGLRILETEYDASKGIRFPLRNLCGATNCFGLERLTVNEY
jgi:hypothetical protein